MDVQWFPVPPDPCVPILKKSFQVSMQNVHEGKSRWRYAQLQLEWLRISVLSSP